MAGPVTSSPPPRSPKQQAHASSKRMLNATAAQFSPKRPWPIRESDFADYWPCGDAIAISSPF
jgi:hypothetical protein